MSPVLALLPPRSDPSDLSAGKIMRRVLRKIACDERDLGDISTLADTSVVEDLFQNRCYEAV